MKRLLLVLLLNCMVVTVIFASDSCTSNASYYYDYHGPRAYKICPGGTFNYYLDEHRARGKGPIIYKFKYSGTVPTNLSVKLHTGDSGLVGKCLPNQPKITDNSITLDNTRFCQWGNAPLLEIKNKSKNDVCFGYNCPK